MPHHKESEFQALEGMEHVRRRPGMYVGGTDAPAMHHLVFEVLDHAAEEAFNRRCNRIDVELRPNQEICIKDNSEGLSVEIIETRGLTLDLILTSFGACGWFPSYRIQGGLHGVGLPVVNGLSEYFRVEVARDCFLWRRMYKAGRLYGEFEKVRALEPDEPTGNTITFRPDFTIMDANDFDFETVKRRCMEVAYLIRDLTVTLTDTRQENAPTFTFCGGRWPARRAD